MFGGVSQVDPAAKIEDALRMRSTALLDSGGRGSIRVARFATGLAAKPYQAALKSTQGDFQMRFPFDRSPVTRARFNNVLPWAAMSILGVVACPAWAKPPDAAFIEQYALAHDFSGSILVARDQEAVYSGTFGRANIEHGVANTSSTHFKAASITKAFTAVLVLQLRDEGKLSLDATIDTYLPDYAGEGASQVLVRQLLNHTSGIENFDKITSASEAIERGLPAYQLPHSSDQLLREFASGKLVAKPGTQFSYNNGDYIILGKIIEKLRGKTYPEVLRERILAPLKMSDSGMLEQSRIVEHLASTYFYRDDLGRLVPDLPVYPENWYAAGALYSTCADLLKFSNALFGGALISTESLALMTTPGLDNYGFGVWTYDTEIAGKKHRVVKRPGQIMGAQSQLYRFLDTPVTVIILSNTGTTDLDAFVAEIGKQMINSQ